MSYSHKKLLLLAIGLFLLIAVFLNFTLVKRLIERSPLRIPDAQKHAGESYQPILGVYKYGACGTCSKDQGPNGIDLYSKWIGKQALYPLDFIPSNNWYDFEHGWWKMFTGADPTATSGSWDRWIAAHPGSRLALAIPMTLGPHPGASDYSASEAAGALTQCANGDYDAHYSALAQNLKNANLGNTILRIGWESQGGWYRWSYRVNPTDWKTCWRRIAKTMKTVSPDFLTNWGVGLGGDMVTSIKLRGFDNYYPGDDLVDEIGIDTYDYPKVSDYPTFFGTQEGWLGWFVQVAAEHNKMLSLPEWGLWGTISGDDTTYIQQMYNWMANPANRVAWHAYFDIHASDGDHQLQEDWRGGTKFPKSAQLFKQLFGQTSVITPTPQTPTPSVTSAPINKSPSATPAPTKVPPPTLTPTPTPFLVDSRSPVVAISHPSAGSRVNKKAVITATASDTSGSIAKIEVLIDGSVRSIAYNTTAVSYHWDAGGYSKTSHTITVRATDPSGNVGAATITVFVR